MTTSLGAKTVDVFPQSFNCVADHPFAGNEKFWAPDSLDTPHNVPLS
jgi:hypothetical protein